MEVMPAKMMKAWMLGMKAGVHGLVELLGGAFEGDHALVLAEQGVEGAE